MDGSSCSSLEQSDNVHNYSHFHFYDGCILFLIYITFQPVVCKHSTEMLSKLNAISKDLIALAELVKDVQKQQSQLNHQLSETKERVLQNSDLIRTVSEQFKAQMSTLLQTQVEQTDVIRAASQKYEEQMRVCKEDVSICSNMCSDIMKQNEGFTDTLQSIREAVMQTAQNTSNAAMEAAGSGSSGNVTLQNNVPHLTHEPMPQNNQTSSENLHNIQPAQPVHNQIQVQLIPYLVLLFPSALILLVFNFVTTFCKVSKYKPSHMPI